MGNVLAGSSGDNPDKNKGKVLDGGMGETTAVFDSSWYLSTYPAITSNLRTLRLLMHLDTIVS